MDSMDFQLRLKPVMDVSDIQGNLGTLQQYLNKLKLPDNMKSGFKETFANAEKEITKIQDILGKKTKTKGDVLGLEKSFGNLDKYINKLSTDMGKLSGKKVLQGVKFDTPEIQKTIQQISDLKQRMSALTGDEVKQVTNAIDEMRNSASKISNVRLDKILNNIKMGNITAAQKELDSLVKYKDKLQTQSVKEDYGVGIKKMQAAIDSLKSKDGIAKITGDIQKLDTTLDGLNANELEKSMIGVGNSASGVKTLADSTRQLGTELKGATAKSVELGNQVNQLKDRAKYFFSLTNGVMLFRRALRQAFNSVKELDASMTEIAVVTDFDIGDMWDKIPEYTKNANELGVSIKSMYDAAGLYYQQGLKTNEVMQLTNETMKMARIAGMEASEATDRMTAALRGFNMEINETSAQKINDVYSQLAAMSASNTDEISGAMTKTASIAANAGMEFETTSAFLAQMIETTREAPENLGTAMKTIVARFTEMKNAPSDIFTDMEGEEVSVNKVDTALRSVGVSLKDANGQFRDLDDVFIELASKWDSLDKNTQRYVATTAAGSRQQSRFIAMMSNYDRTMELVNAANTSAGASQDQFSKTTESLESKLARLKNAWDQFVTGIANSTLIKTGIDLLTGFLNIINKLTTGFGILKGDVGGIISSFLKIGTAIAGLNIGKNIINFGFDKFAARFVKAGQDAGAAYSAGFGQRASAGLHKTMNAIAHPVKTATSVKQSLTKDFTAKDRENIIQKNENKYKKGAGKTKGINKQIKIQSNAGNIEKEAKATKVLNQAQKEQAATLNNVAAAKGFSNATAQQANAIAAQNIAYLGAETSATTLLQAAEGGLTAAKLAELQAQMIANGMDEEQIANNTQLIIGKYAEAGATAAATAAQNTENVTANMGLLTKIKFYATLLFGTKTKIANTAATYGLSAAEAAEAVAAGTATTAQWLLNAAIYACPLGWIAAAAVALVAIFIGLAAAIQTDTEKMERLNETSEGLGEQLSTTNERLADITEQQSGLQKLNDELNGLTKGSAEWNNKLLEINQTILDLIDKYPLLTEYMSIGKDGQMSISKEGFEKVIEQQQEAIKSLQFAKQAVNLSITRLQKDMDARKMATDKLDANIGKTDIALTGAAMATSGTGLSPQVFTGAIAKQIISATNMNKTWAAVLGAALGGVSGAIGGYMTATEEKDEDLLQQKIAEGMNKAGISAQDSNLLQHKDELSAIYQQAGGNMALFNNWLQKLSSSSEAVKEQFDTMGQTARQSTIQQDAQTKAIASTIVNQDAELSDSKYKEALINSISTEQVDAATQDMIDKLGKTWGVDDNWGYDNYDKRLESEYAKLMGITREEAKAQREANEITKEQMEAAVAGQYAQEDLTKATEKLKDAFITLEKSMPDKADDVNRIMAGQGTEKDYNDFITDKNNKKRDMSHIFANINSENDSEKTSAITQAREIIREEYGNTFANSLTPEMIQSFITSLMGLESIIEDRNIHDDMNITNTPENSGGFSVAAQNNMSKVYTTENSEVLNNIFSAIAGQLTAENENEVNSLIASTDFFDADSIETTMKAFKSLGMSVEGFDKQLIDAVHATREYSGEQRQSIIKAQESAEEILSGRGANDTSFTEDEKNTLVKTKAVDDTDFVQLGSRFIYLGGSINDLREAVQKNTAAQLDEAYRSDSEYFKTADKVTNKDADGKTIDDRIKAVENAEKYPGAKIAVFENDAERDNYSGPSSVFGPTDVGTTKTGFKTSLYGNPSENPGEITDGLYLEEWGTDENGQRVRIGTQSMTISPEALAAYNEEHDTNYITPGEASWGKQGTLVFHTSDAAADIFKWAKGKYGDRDVTTTMGQTTAANASGPDIEKAKEEAIDPMLNFLESLAARGEITQETYNALKKSRNYDDIKAEYDKHTTGDGNYTPEKIKQKRKEQDTSYFASEAFTDAGGLMEDIETENASEDKDQTYIDKMIGGLEAYASSLGVAKTEIIAYKKAMKSTDPEERKAAKTALYNAMQQAKAAKAIKEKGSALKSTMDQYKNGDKDEYILQMGETLGLDMTNENNKDWVEENLPDIEGWANGSEDAIKRVQASQANLLAEQLGDTDSTMTIGINGDVSGFNGQMGLLSQTAKETVDNLVAAGTYTIEETTVKPNIPYLVPQYDANGTLTGYKTEKYTEAQTIKVVKPAAASTIKKGVNGGGSSGGGGGSGPQKNTKKTWHHNRDVKSEKRQKKLADFEHEIAMEQSKQIPNLEKIIKLNKDRYDLLKKEASQQKANYKASLKEENRLWKKARKKGYDKLLNKDGTVNLKAYNKKEWDEKAKEAFDEWESDWDDTREYTRSSKEAWQDAKLQVAELKNARSEYTKLTNLAEKYENISDKITKRQSEYNRELNKANTSGKTLVSNLIEQENHLKNQLQLQKDIQAAAKQAAIDYRKQSGVGKYVSANLNTGEHTINYDKINALAKQGIDIEPIEEAIDAYVEYLDQIAEANMEQNSILDEIDNTLQERMTAIVDLQNRVREAIIQSREEEIDALSTIDSSINDTNSKILAAVQDNISKLRQDRKNEQTEEDLADKQARLAYLRQYTGTGNAAEIAKLEDEIRKGEESYTDTLIDQKISELQKQNDEASQQRQRQIKIMQEQLKVDQENGKITAEARNLMTDGILNGVIDTGSDLYKLLALTGGWANMSPEELQQTLNEIEGLAAHFSAYNIGNNLVGTKGSDYRKGSTISFQDKNGNTIKSGKITGKGTVEVTDSKGVTSRYTGVGQDANGTVVAPNSRSVSGQVNVSQDTPIYTSSKAKEIATNTGRGTSTYRGGAYNVIDETKDMYKIQYYDDKGNLQIGWVSKGNVNKDNQLISTNDIIKLDEAGQKIAKKSGFIGINGNKGYYYVVKNDNGVLTLKQTKDGKKTFTINEKNATLLNRDEGKKATQNLQYLKDDRMLYKFAEGIKLSRKGKNDKEFKNATAKQVKAILGKKMSFVGKDKKGFLQFRTPGKGAKDAATWKTQSKNPTKIKQFKTGGLADFTGPAWLDGTKTKPEIILNQKDTENFIQLRNILSDVMKGVPSKSNQNNGDSYAEIHINVEKMTSDYDVDQVAKRVKKILNEDGRYRTVNQINRLR